MKIVINRCYGGFDLSEEFIEAFPQFDIWTVERDDEAFIEALESFGLDNASGQYSNLNIEEIPSDATDWIVNEHDGLESLIYVLNGKICYA